MEISDIDLAYDTIERFSTGIRKRRELELERLVMDRFKAKGFEFETKERFEAFCAARVTNMKLGNVNHLIVDAKTKSSIEICAFKNLEASDIDFETGNFTIKITPSS